MKYSFMSFSTPELDLAGMFDAARRFGYDGIEPRLDSNHAHGVETGTTATERESIRRQALESGIELACIATSITYADPSKTEAMLSKTHETIDLAGDLAVPAIRVFGGRIPEGFSRDEATDLLVRSLSSVAGHAGDRGVVICVETHDDWSDPAHVAAVLARVDHPAIGANWDVMHPVRAAKLSIDAAFDMLRPWIHHLHIHDGNAAGLAPIGTGDIDHRRVVELLRGVDYRGFISGEWIGWEPFETHLPRELAAMKSYENAR